MSLWQSNTSKSNHYVTCLPYLGLAYTLQIELRASLLQLFWLQKQVPSERQDYLLLQLHSSTKKVQSYQPNIVHFDCKNVPSLFGQLKSPLQKLFNSRPIIVSIMTFESTTSSDYRESQFTSLWCLTEIKIFKVCLLQYRFIVYTLYTASLLQAIKTGTPQTLDPLAILKQVAQGTTTRQPKMYILQNDIN